MHAQIIKIKKLRLVIKCARVCLVGKAQKAVERKCR